MKKFSKILTGIFIAWIAVFMLAIIALPDKSFSETENRYLAQKPEFSLSALKSGKFAKDFESYINDQFAGRNLFVKLNTLSEYVMGQREINNVFIGKDGTLMGAPVSEESIGNMQNTVSAINSFAEKTNVPVYFALIPSAYDICTEEHRNSFPPSDEKSIIQSLYEMSDAECIDIYNALSSHSNEYIYYKTDHHWTSLGAYYGYRTIADTMNLEAKDISEMSDTTASNGFYGTLYSKVPLFWLKGDEIHTYVSDSGVNVKSFNGKDWSDSKLYFDENLNIKDKYTYFLGQNEPLIVINTENTDKPKLLIIRDSYSDSLAPFLTQNFSEIHLLDPRYYKLSVADYVADNNIDSVIICYSLSNFSEDKNLSLVLSR